MASSKKPKLWESDEDEGPGHVVDELRRNTAIMKYLQKKIKKINVKEDNKVSEVLQKCSETRREIYNRRNEVLATLPRFWLVVIYSHPVLREFFNEEDRKILKYLVSLHVKENSKLGFSITFNFSPNPYFKNEKLTKTYSFHDESTVATGATIEWKERLDKELEDMSFFMWLTRSQQISVLVEEDKIASTIKGCIWPDPLKYIFDVTKLDGEGGMQNVAEEGSGHHDNEIEEKGGDEEGGENDAEESGIGDQEIDEGGEFDAEEEGAIQDDEIEEHEDEEGDDEGAVQDDDDDDEHGL